MRTGVEVGYVEVQLITAAFGSFGLGHRWLFWWHLSNAI
jgi:hypothetical protein